MADGIMLRQIDIPDLLLSTSNEVPNTSLGGFKSAFLFISCGCFKLNEIIFEGHLVEFVQTGLEVIQLELKGSFGLG